MRKKHSIFVIVLHIIIQTRVITSVQCCHDENNNPVDWFVIYKLPELKNHDNPLVKNGVAYSYITSDNEHDWVLSNKSINDTTSMPGMTLASLYDSSVNMYSQAELYILYNDEPPEGDVKFSGGHTKGVVVTGESGGFWLVHSVPHYPPLPSTHHYSYPHTGIRYGQSFLCVSALSDYMDVIGELLMYNYPNIFANNIPVELTAKYPTLTKAAVGKDVNTPPWYHSGPLVSIKGTTFQAFAKSPKFQKDLYSDWVATALEVSLLVETWPNGPGRLNSSCNQHYQVENVDEVSVGDVRSKFSTHKDHSKWAISKVKQNPWVCIGDINRAESQAERGGGTVCVMDPVLWQAYYSAVTGVESCSKQHNPSPKVVMV